MANRKCKRPQKATKKAPKPGRKPTVTRQSYPLWVKSLARSWHFKDKIGVKAVVALFKSKLCIDATPSTVCTWWNPANMAKVEADAPDRYNVNDTRLNPKQRPAVLVDTEKILARKVIGNILQWCSLYKCNNFNTSSTDIS